MKHAITVVAVFSLFLVVHSARSAEVVGPGKLENKQLRVVFDKQGLTQIHDKALGRTIDFKGDRFVLKVDDTTVDSKTIKPQAVGKAGKILTYRYKVGK